MTLQAVEFIRRFLLHVLPLYFVRIRHYGFLANRVCQEKLGSAARCWALMQLQSRSPRQRSRSRDRAQPIFAP